MKEYHCRGCGNITYEKSSYPSHKCSACGKKDWTTFTTKKTYKCTECGTMITWSSSYPNFPCINCKKRNWKTF